ATKYWPDPWLLISSLRPVPISARLSSPPRSFDTCANPISELRHSSRSSADMTLQWPRQAIPPFCFPRLDCPRQQRKSTGLHPGVSAHLYHPTSLRRVKVGVSTSTNWFRSAVRLLARRPGHCSSKAWAE